MTDQERGKVSSLDVPLELRLVTSDEDGMTPDEAEDFMASAVAGDGSGGASS